nr:CD59 glycoprotein [Pogona vitticeps]
MKCLSVITLITVFLLALFCSSGSALRCFTCRISPCNVNKTCSAEQDACIKVDLGSRIEKDCWKYSDCDVDKVGEHFNVKNLKLSCCQKDLCNGSPITVGSKLVLGISSFLVVIRMLCF